MLEDVWPLAGLRIQVAELELRPPDDAELADLAALAGRGVHPPGERPFLTPWTDGTADDRAHNLLRSCWDAAASWHPTDWRLFLGVFAGGRPVGQVTLRARDFAVVREVTSFSWFGLEHHGHGYGTQARTGLLSLAFNHLDAVAATSEVFQDNHASQAVSRRLGYLPDGISRDARGDEVLVSDRLRLSRERWATRDQPVPVTVTGLDRCRSWFGA